MTENIYFINDQHKTAFIQALADYDTRPDSERGALLYCVTATEKPVSDFIEKTGMGLYIKPEALDGTLSSGERILISLGYHLYTWQESYSVPEIEFCNLGYAFFEAVIQALRLRTGFITRRKKTLY